MTTIGLDIGGANLKLATSDGGADHRPFALWRQPEQLADELAAMLAPYPRQAALGVVMTGELADCFATRTEGVVAIARAVERAAPDRPLAFFGLDGQWHVRRDVDRRPLEFSAANWLALAAWVADRFPQADLLIDVGTTTTDIIALSNGRPAPRARDDVGRLATSELLYRGVVRTPLFGLAPTVPYRNLHLPLVPEFFATTLDIYIVREQLEQHVWNDHTADGRPADLASSRARLGRAILVTEPDAFQHDDVRVVAETLHESLVEQLGACLGNVLDRTADAAPVAVVSGTGEFLAREAVARRFAAPHHMVSLTETLGAMRSMCAPAFAAAMLLAAELSS